MKDFLLPLLGFGIFAAAPPVDAPLWERLLEKWGIAFVGIFLLWKLAQWTEKREAAAQVKRDAADKAAAEAKELADKQDREERNALLQRNNELQARQIEIVTSHAQRLEQLTKDGTKAVNDSGAAMRMLIRKMRRPCVAPFTFPEDAR